MWSPSRNRRTEGAEFRSEHGWHHESRRFRPVEGDESAFLRPNLRPLNPPPPGRGRRPRAASLAPLGQFTFCPHRPALCQAGAPSMLPFLTPVSLSCLRRAPFCADRKGRKSRLRRGIPISPALTIHPLKRPRRGNCDSPFLELPPSRSIGSFPAAGAYSVTPPPLRPVWKERPRNTGVGLVPARGRHEPDAPDCHTHSPNFNREVTP